MLKEYINLDEMIIAMGKLMKDASALQEIYVFVESEDQLVVRVEHKRVNLMARGEFVLFPMPHKLKYMTALIMIVTF